MKLNILHNVDALFQRSLIVVLLRTCDASPLDHCVRFSNSMFNSGLACKAITCRYKSKNVLNNYYSRFRVFSPNCTLHTAITHVIAVLEQWSHVNSDGIIMREAPPF